MQAGRDLEGSQSESEARIIGRDGSHSDIGAGDKSSGDESMFCEVCQIEEKGKKDLKRHKKLIHGEAPFVCKTCERTLMWNGNVFGSP